MMIAPLWPNAAHAYIEPRSWWIGVLVMEGWVQVQPLPCIGVAFRRRRAR